MESGNSATWNGTITLAGDGRTQLSAKGTMTLQGTINGSSNELLLRGHSGTGNLSSTVSIGSTNLFKTDNSTWTINSTGNTWGQTQIVDSTLKLGISSALPSATVVTIGQGDGNNVTFDLNAKNQTIAGLVDGGTTGGTKKITNSGGSASTLTINNSSDYTYSYLIENGTSAINLIKSGSGTRPWPAPIPIRVQLLLPAGN